MTRLTAIMMMARTSRAAFGLSILIIQMATVFQRVYGADAPSMAATAAARHNCAQMRDDWWHVRKFTYQLRTR